MSLSDIDWKKREIRVIGTGNKETACPLGQKALGAPLEYSRHYEDHWGRKKPDGPAPLFLSMWNTRLVHPDHSADH